MHAIDKWSFFWLTGKPGRRGGDAGTGLNRCNRHRNCDGGATTLNCLISKENKKNDKFDRTAAMAAHTEGAAGNWNRVVTNADITERNVHDMVNCPLQPYIVIGIHRCRLPCVGEDSLTGF